MATPGVASLLLVAVVGALLVAFGAGAKAQAPPVRAGIEFLSSPANGDTYTLGEAIEVWVQLWPPQEGGEYRDRDSHQWTLSLTIGSLTRTIQPASTEYAGDLTSGWHFSYSVQAEDHDEDGVGIASGSIRNTNSGRVVWHLPVADDRSHKVDGSIVEPPRIRDIRLSSLFTRTRDVYTQGEEILFDVVFDRQVSVSGRLPTPARGDAEAFEEWSQGTPRLALTVGTERREALLWLWSVVRTTTGTELTFGYTVRAGDTDVDGISVAADSLDLNGGAITLAADRNVAANLSHGEIVISAAKVDADFVRTPSVSGVSYYYGFSFAGDAVVPRGARVIVRVLFDAPVVAKGAPPQLTLTVGSATRTAQLLSYGTELFTFRYIVQASDSGRVGVAANSLRGNIVSATDGTTPANLTHAAARTGRRVAADGSVPARIRLDTYWTPKIGFGRPANGSTYARGEVIRVSARFGVSNDFASSKDDEEPVAVSGSPRLALTIGSATRYAGYLFSVGPTLIFGYEVRAEDRDADGISIPADALDLNGGAITLAADEGIAADLRSRALADNPGLKVDGRLPPPAGAAGAADGEGRAGVEVRVNARRLEDGRIEFGVQERDGSGWADRILPSQRHFPAAGGARWLSSSPVTVGGE